MGTRSTWTQWAVAAAVLIIAALGAIMFISASGRQLPWASASQPARMGAQTVAGIPSAGQPMRILSVRPGPQRALTVKGTTILAVPPAGQVASFRVEPLSTADGVRYQIRSATGQSCVVPSGGTLTLIGCGDADGGFVLSPVGRTPQGERMFNLLTPDGGSVEISKSGEVSVAGHTQSSFASRWVFQSEAAGDGTGSGR
jgi:hypothetical protein